LFALVSFGLPDGSVREDAAQPVVSDDGALRLIVVEEEMPEDPTRLEPAASAAPASSDDVAVADADGAPAAAPAPGGADPAAPPVLLAYHEPIRSPLLLPGATEDVASTASTASARAATYTPGGVRKAKLGWSGQDEAKARRDGRIRALLAGTGDGHCPARPPGRDPFGL
jgi:hypothetical protein